MSLPNVPAKVFSFSAVVVGYLLIDDLTTNEQNALGNWLMLVAQILCTNAFYKQVEAERNMNKNPNKEDTISMMEKMIKAMQEELNALKQTKK